MGSWCFGICLKIIVINLFINILYNGHEQFIWTILNIEKNVYKLQIVDVRPSLAVLQTSSAHYLASKQLVNLFEPKVSKNVELSAPVTSDCVLFFARRLKRTLFIFVFDIFFQEFLEVFLVEDHILLVIFVLDKCGKSFLFLV